MSKKISDVFSKKSTKSSSINNFGNIQQNSENGSKIHQKSTINTEKEDKAIKIELEEQNENFSNQNSSFGSKNSEVDVKCSKIDKKESNLKKYSSKLPADQDEDFSDQKSEFEENNSSFEDNSSKIEPKLRDCRVILKDIMHEVELEQIKNIEAIKNEPERQLLIVLSPQKIIKTHKPIKTEENFEKDSKTRKFRCKICRKLLVSNYNVIKHLEVHAQLKHKCEKCGIILKSQKFIKTHECENECRFCVKEFCDNHTLWGHQIKNHENELKIPILSCEICGLKFSKELFLNKHKKLKHFDGKIQLFTCDLDGKTFPSKTNIKKHLEFVHLQAKLIKCKICDAKVKQCSMKSHMKGVHAKNLDFQCELCQKSYKSLVLLRMHKKTHNKKFQCQICDKKFTNKFKLDQHLKDFHENPMSYKCEQCGLKFNENKGLQSHQKIHLENRQKSFKCTKCDHSTHNKSLLKKHLRFHERIEKKVASMKQQFKCNLCSYIGASRKNLNGHRWVNHFGTQYECDFCGSLQKIKRNMLGHIERRHLKGSESL